MVEGKHIYIREIKIGTAHTINFGNFENIKVSAELTFGVPVGCSDEELRGYINDAQQRLKELLTQTYLIQKPKDKQPVKLIKPENEHTD